MLKSALRTLQSALLLLHFLNVTTIMDELSILTKSEESITIPGWNEDLEDVVQIQVQLDKTKLFVCISPC